MAYVSGNANLRASFATLMKKVPEIFELLYNELKRRPQIYNQICEIGTMDRKTITLNVLGGLGSWSSKSEGAEYSYANFAQGTEVTVTATTYANAFDISQEMQEDNQWAKAMSNASEMAQGAYDVVETAAATLYNNAFTSGTGADGNYLCDPAGHNLINSSETGYNAETAALSPTGLSEMKQLGWDVVDDANIRVFSDYKVLLIPPELETTAKEIMTSQFYPYSTDRGDNIWKGTYDIVVDPFLT